jgi:hypothetical protein
LIYGIYSTRYSRAGRDDGKVCNKSAYVAVSAAYFLRSVFPSFVKRCFKSAFSASSVAQIDKNS